MSESVDRQDYSNKYRDAHYDLITLKLRKEKRYKERIKALADRDNISMSQWIIRAIEKELEWYE